MTKNYKPEVEEAIKTLDFANKTYQIELNTNHGRILLDLLPDVAPGHCANMLALIAILPPVAVVIFFQSWFVKGLTESDK